MRARFKLATDGEIRLVLCGKPDKAGRLTCPGVLGRQPPLRAGPPRMWVNGIFQRDSRGEFRLNNRALKQRAEGRPIRLRRSHVRVGLVAGNLPDMRDYGPQAERAVEIVYDFPFKLPCPRCLTPNEIQHFSHTA